METPILQPSRDLGRYRAELAAFTPEIVDGCPVSIRGEPLLRERDGRLWQAIRLQVDRASVPRVTVHAADGTSIECDRIDLRGAAVRLLVPAVEQPVELTVHLHFTEREVHVPILVQPQRRWNIHLVHHSHLDIGYTDPQRVIGREQVAYLDACLALAARTDDLPDDARFRWCVEALWVYERWAAQRDADVLGEFFNRVEEGRFELTALPFTLHTETCSVDELHELLRPARELCRRRGIATPVAMQTDVPGMAIGSVDALADAGVRYLSVAHNWAGRSLPHHSDGQRLPRLFRWMAPSGRSLLVWITDTAHGWYMEGNFLGLHESYEDACELLPTYLSRLASEPYPYSVRNSKFLLPPVEGPIEREPYPWDVLHLRVQGRLVDNGPPSDSLPDLVAQWNAEWAFPKLRLSRNQDFFAEAEARHGDDIELLEGDWNDWWTDGVGSAAQPLAITREAQRSVVEGQTLEGAARLLGAKAADVDEPVQAAYRAISLFNEHTWGAANPWTVGEDGVDSGQAQWQWKTAKALEAAERSDDLAQRAAVRVGRTLGRGAGAPASLYVINPTGWARTDLVTTFVGDELVDRGAELAVRDMRTGRVVPHEERRETSLSRRPGRHMQFVAADVPACGLARFDLQPAGPPPRAEPAPSAAGVLSNEHLRVEIDLVRGCIGSLVDLATGRELVNLRSRVGLNAYVYDRYASTSRVSVLSCVLADDGSLSLLASREMASNAALVDRRSTEVAEELSYELRPPGADRVLVTLRLAHGVPRLDVVNRVVKPWTEGKESAFFAFPFAVEDPTVRFEVSGGMTGPDMNVVPGSARHMRAIRRWVSLEGSDGYAVAWATHDAPLIQQDNIALPYTPFPPTMPGEPEPATLFSWIHNNVMDTNFPSSQSFDMRFRYSIAAGRKRGPVLAARTAAAPLKVVPTGRDGAEAHTELSLIGLDDERVRIVGLAPTPDGAVLLRLQSFAEEAVSLRVRIPPGHQTASRATFAGEPVDRLAVEDGSVHIEVPPCATAALLLHR